VRGMCGRCLATLACMTVTDVSQVVEFGEAGGGRKDTASASGPRYTGTHHDHDGPTAHHSDTVREGKLRIRAHSVVRA
jgi:hypothetical protein